MQQHAIRRPLRRSGQTVFLAVLIETVHGPNSSTTDRDEYDHSNLFLFKVLAERGSLFLSLNFDAGRATSVKTTRQDVGPVMPAQDGSWLSGDAGIVRSVRSGRLAVNTPPFSHPCLLFHTDSDTVRI